MSTFRHSDRARQYARQAYQSFEPLHLVAYFSPQVGAKAKELGLKWGESYFGFRGAPLGRCSAPVVNATFYNWNPEGVEKGWTGALAKYDPDQLIAAREDIADGALTEAFGEELVSSDALPRVVDRFNELLASAEPAGRALGAANLALATPAKPHVALWQAFTTLREWRGDGHIAALVVNGLSPVEALVFHEAQHPDPSVKSSKMGREQTQSSRRWSDADWTEAAEGLASRGLLEFADGGERLTSDGAALYQVIEDQTDDASAGIWEDVSDADELFAAARPFVKAVIDSGFLPGTQKKG